MAEGEIHVGIEVRGKEQFRELSRRLRRTADGRELGKRLQNQIRAAGRPVLEEIKSSVRSIPTKGVSTKRVRSRTANATTMRTTSRGGRDREAGVQYAVNVDRLGNESAMPGLWDRKDGSWRHPLFGNRAHWYRQESHPWFYTTIRRNDARFRRAVNQAIQETALFLERG